MPQPGTPSPDGPAPQAGYYLLNTDGGMVSTGRRARGDAPGEAAIGVVLRNSKGILVEKFSRAIGPATNDVAEYKALIEGLRFALDRGISHIRVYLDSEFVVEQVNNNSEVEQEHLKPLHNEARSLVNKFAPKTGIRISWVPRERNKDADELVREALYPPTG